jgi:murein DD-endopeptidase MepM/ murein hydrolase activator NlpD
MRVQSAIAVCVMTAMAAPSADAQIITKPKTATSSVPVIRTAPQVYRPAPVQRPTYTQPTQRPTYTQPAQRPTNQNGNVLNLPSSRQLPTGLSGNTQRVPVTRTTNNPANTLKLDTNKLPAGLKPLTSTSGSSAGDGPKLVPGGSNASTSRLVSSSTGTATKVHPADKATYDYTMQRMELDKQRLGPGNYEVLYLPTANGTPLPFVLDKRKGGTITAEQGEKILRDQLKLQQGGTAPFGSVATSTQSTIGTTTSGSVFPPVKVLPGVLQPPPGQQQIFGSINTTAPAAVPASNGGASIFPPLLPNTTTGHGSNGFNSPSYVQDQHKRHLGSDLKAAGGSQVYAPVDGKVVWIRQDPDPYKAVVIVEQAGSKTQYVLGHIESGLKLGDPVTRGQSVGKIMEWGSRSHLHFGKNVDGKAIPKDSVWGWGRAPENATPEELRQHGWVDPGF